MIKQVCITLFFISAFCTVNAQINLPKGKDLLQLKDGTSLQTNILFTSAGYYYFVDATANYYSIQTDLVNVATGKIPERKDFGGYYQNMLHVYSNASVGAGLLLGGVALAGFGAIISAGFDDSQAVAVPMMAIGGVASLTGLVTLTVSLHQGKTSQIKMLAKSYK